MAICFESNTVLANEKILLVDARTTFNGDPDIEVRSATAEWVHFRVTPSMELREKFSTYIRGALADLPVKVCEEICLAVDELLSNSFEHGCHEDARCSVDFKLMRTSRIVMVQIRDSGPGFSVHKVTHAAVNNPPEQPLRHSQLRSEMGMRPGGFGILLVKKIADELIYNEQGNEVMLVKYLDGI